MNALQLYAFADEASNTLDGQIAAMTRNQLNGLEIRNLDGESISSISLKKAGEVKAKLDHAGLKVWSIGSPIGKIGIEDPFAPHLDLLKHTLEVAAVLKAERIRLFSFYLPQGEDPALFRNQVMDRMGQMLEAAQGSGVLLCHENEKGIYGDLACRCLELHQAFPALGGVFDPANFIQCGQNTWDAWQMLKEYINYLHIKDALEDGSVVPAGHGIGRVGDILADYRARGGCQLTLEPHLMVFDGLKALERSGEETLINPFVYDSNHQAFDAACEALKALI